VVGDGRLVGLVDLGQPPGPVGLRHADIGRNGRSVADRRGQVRRVRLAVAVDHQPRIGLADETGVEARRQPLAGRGDADVPGDVAVHLGHRDAQIAERARNGPSGVIAQKQKGRASALVCHHNGRQIVRTEQSVRPGR
jgi:hypothetical protein